MPKQCGTCGWWAYLMLTQLGNLGTCAATPFSMIDLRQYRSKVYSHEGSNCPCWKTKRSWDSNDSGTATIKCRECGAEVIVLWKLDPAHTEISHTCHCGNSTFDIIFYNRDGVEIDA